jgi:hypothetical protein
MANYMKQRAAFISAGFQAGLQAGRQQILDMMSLVLRDPKYVKKDIHGAERLLTIVKGIGDYIDIYQDAWQKTDETDYVRAKLDAALAEAYGPGLHDSFTQRYDTAPEYDYTKGKWKK